MFHNHPALVQTLLDDRAHRALDRHHVPSALAEVRSPASTRATRRAQRRRGQ